MRQCGGSEHRSPFLLESDERALAKLFGGVSALNKATEFWQLADEVKKRLIRCPAVVNEDIANNYELSGATDLIKQYVDNGQVRVLAEAIRRFRYLFESRGRADRNWASFSLPRLHALGLDLTVDDRLTIVEQPAIPHAVLSLKEARSNRLPSCDLLVIAALHDPELSAFLNCLEDVHDATGPTESFLPGITYYTGTLPRPLSSSTRTLSVGAVFQNRTGMVDCAILAVNAVRYFSPRLLAMTGVCAGRSKSKVKINDLLLPSSVLTFDTGKHSSRGFEREPLWAEVDDRIVQRVRTVGSIVMKGLVDRVNKGRGDTIRDIPMIHTDVMACGSTVINYAKIMDSLGGANRKVMGVDMESYACLRAAKLTDPHLRTFVVKGVMDLGFNKSDSQKARAAFWAANFLASFVANEFDSLSCR